MAIIPVSSIAGIDTSTGKAVQLGGEPLSPQYRETVERQYYQSTPEYAASLQTPEKIVSYGGSIYGYSGGNFYTLEGANKISRYSERITSLDRPDLVYLLGQRLGGVSEEQARERLGASKAAEARGRAGSVATTFKTTPGEVKSKIEARAQSSQQFFQDARTAYGGGGIAQQAQTILKSPTTTAQQKAVASQLLAPKQVNLRMIQTPYTPPPGYGDRYIYGPQNVQSITGQTIGAFYGVNPFTTTQEEDNIRVRIAGSFAQDPNFMA